MIVEISGSDDMLGPVPAKNIDAPHIAASAYPLPTRYLHR